jgi:hypothetical protein
MKKQKLLIFFIFPIILIVGLIFWRYSQDTESDSTFDTPKTSMDDYSKKDYLNEELVEYENNDSADTTIDWELLINNNYSLKYPKEATVETRDNESLVYFMGQKQIDSGRTQTELFDGYSFRLEKILDNSANSLVELSTKERNNAIENCNYENGSISDLIALKIDGKEAFQYYATGCYIDYTESFVSYNGEYYRISQSYVGDEEDYMGYKDITKNILSTIKYID